MNKFQLDIITPTSITSYDNISYLRIPAIDGLTGIQANHAPAIIGLQIGEIKLTINGKDKYFATSGGFSEIKKDGVQLLLETIEDSSSIDKTRAQKALIKAQRNVDGSAEDRKKVKEALQRAKNRLNLIDKQ